MIENVTRTTLTCVGLIALLGAPLACGSDEVDDTDPSSRSSNASADTGVSDTGEAPERDSEGTTGEGSPDTSRGDTSRMRDTGPESRDTSRDTGRPEDGGDTGGETRDGGVSLSVQSITPARGPVTGGTPFVLEGVGLTRETDVYFGSRKAEVNLVNDRLVGQTPEGAGPGDVPVKALDPDTGDDVLEDGFTYTTTLQFDSATPRRLPTDGGTTVTIKGRGFDQKTRVSFDGQTARRHTWVDAQTLRVVAPAHQAGSVDLRLTNRDATTLAEDAVRYVEPLQIEQIRPAVGPTTGGTQVTLRGRGLSSNMTVRFGSNRATVVSVGSKGQTATVRTPARTSSGLVDVSVATSKGKADLLEDGFYYRTSASDFRVATVDPAVAQTSGQIEVELRGAGLDRSGLSVTFGGDPATLVDRGPGHAIVKVPSHPPGVVDVAATDGSGQTSTLTNGFKYVETLELDGATPGRGKTRAKTRVTLRGDGFQGVASNGSVRFGSIPASFKVVSDTEIRATAPPHSAGTVDITVERGDVEATLEDGFTYTESLEVFGLSPIRGSMAGDTYVTLRGAGFRTGQMEVTFGGDQASSVQVLDAHTLAVRTPPHKPQAVDVVVTRDQTTVKAPQQYTYFNPGARNGGTWGGPIQGAVNVSVYSKGGRPIPRAFVMLSTDPDTTYQGKTNRNGRVTLSGPDVYGEQTITAIAPKYSSTTVQRVDSENVTIFLNPPSSNGQPPPGPPTATFKGTITGLNKIAKPEPDQILVAIVRATRKNPWSEMPDPGDQNVVRRNGDYKLTTRVGDLALVAIGGLQDRSSGEFTPLKMGVKRFQFAAQGKTYTRDIDLNIPLDETMAFKLQNVPPSSSGADTNRVVPYLDFGFEGVFGNFDVARSTRSLLRVQHQPALSGKLSDVSYTLIGGSYTSRPDGDDPDDQPDLGPPQSVAIKRNVKQTGGVIQLPPLPAIAQVTSPASGEKPVDGLISFKTGSSNQPDFYYARVLTPRNRAIWEAFVPGSANSITLPDFPDFSNLPKKRRPKPYPGGTYRLSITGIEHPGVTYGNFSYSDLSIDKWEAFSIGGQLIRFGP